MPSFENNLRAFAAATALLGAVNLVDKYQDIETAAGMTTQEVRARISELELTTPERNGVTISGMPRGAAPTPEAIQKITTRHRQDELELLRDLLAERED